MVEEYGQNGAPAEKALTVNCLDCGTPISVPGQWAKCPKCDLILIRGKEQGEPFAEDPLEAFTRMMMKMFEEMIFQGPEADEPEGARRTWLSWTLVQEVIKAGRKVLGKE